MTAFDKHQVSRFRFVRCDFAADTGVARLVYAFDDGPELVETVTVPGAPFALDGARAAAATRALRLLHLIAGVSYYKAAVPGEIRIDDYAIDAGTAALLEDVYVHGLGEFAYRNGLNLHGRIRFPVSADEDMRAGTLGLRPHALVAIGGGKDSLVSIEALRRAGVDETVTWIGGSQLIRACAERTGLPLPEAPATAGAASDAAGAPGYGGLFGDFLAPALLIGLVSATGLLLVYSLNTWLPELMLRAGFNAKGSLSFLVVLNGGAVLGPLVAARFADRLGPKPVVAASFLTGAVAILLLTLELPLPLLLCIVALAGMGTSGTQTLIYGFVANYFPTRVRGASVGWCAGFGRLGGVGGPLIGGLLIAAGLSIQAILTVLAALALLGIVLTLLVPAPRAAAAA